MKLLVDHGGFANVGDTAMLEGVCLRLMHLFPEAEISVVDHPGLRTTIWRYAAIRRQKDYTLKPFWRDLCQNLKFFWRFDPYWRRMSMRVALRFVGTVVSARALISHCENEPTSSGVSLGAFCENFDGLHIAGGGNLTDSFLDQLFKRSCLISAFVDQGKPVVLTGQQIGPFTSRLSRIGLSRILSRVSFVGLREPTQSLEFCREAGLNPRQFQVMGDDSFGAPIATDTEREGMLAKYGLTAGKFLAVNFRMASYAQELSRHLGLVGEIVNRVAALQQMPIVIVPIAFGVDSDVHSSKQLSEAVITGGVVMLEPEDVNPSTAKALIGSAFGAIGVSYHFCIFALSQGVPTVCLYDGEYYSQKAHGLCAFWGDNQFALSLRNLDADSALRHLMQLYNDNGVREKLRTKGADAVEHWRHIFDHHVTSAFRPSRQTGLQA